MQIIFFFTIMRVTNVARELIVIVSTFTACDFEKDPMWKGYERRGGERGGEKKGSKDGSRSV